MCASARCRRNHSSPVPPLSQCAQGTASRTHLSQIGVAARPPRTAHRTQHSAAQMSDRMRAHARPQMRPVKPRQQGQAHAHSLPPWLHHCRRTMQCEGLLVVVVRAVQLPQAQWRHSTPTQWQPAPLQLPAAQKSPELCLQPWRQALKSACQSSVLGEATRLDDQMMKIWNGHSTWASDTTSTPISGPLRRRFPPLR